MHLRVVTLYRGVGTALLALAVSVSIGGRAPAQDSASDPFEGDRRLAVPRSISAHDRAVRDLLADLELQTGIRFFADDTVRDDRVTLMAHDRPLSDALRAIGTLFGFTWARSGTAPDFGYMLTQSPAAAEREDAARRARLQAAVATISDEAEAYARLEPLPEAEVQRRAESTARELADEKDAGRRRQLAIEHAACAQILTRSEWRSLVNRLIHALTQERISQLIQQGTVEYVWPDHIGFSQVPREALPDAAGNVGRADGGGQINFFRVRFSGSQGRSPRLQWHVVVGRQQAHAFDVTESGGMLPDVDADSNPSPASVDSRPAGDLAAEVSLTVGPPAGGDGTTGRAMGRPSLGDALAALDRAHPLDIVADAFYPTRVAGFRQEKRPVAEALDRLAQMTDHRWWRENGFVMLRSVDYEEDRAAEPPSDALARWTASALHDGLDLDDYAEMAVLPDSKLTTLLHMAVRGDFPAQLTPLTQARDHLRLWDALTRAQRRKARSQGVVWSEMTEAQRKLLLLATTDQKSGSSFRVLPSGAISGLRMRVEAHETRLWGVRHGEGGSVSGVGSRDMAFQQFSRSDRALKLGDVKTVVFATDAFVYENDRGMVVSRVWLTLPPRWEEPPVGS